MLQISILLPLLAIFIIPLIRKKIRNVHLGYFVFFIPLVIFVYFVSKITTIYNGNNIISNLNFASNVGLDLNLKLDGLSLLFSLLITGIGTLVIIYSIFYMNKEDSKLHKFYIFLMIFMASMLGIVLSDNMLSMYMSWEFTSISSFLLISYWHESEVSRKGALKSLLITVLGGLCMLVGIFIIREITGSFNLTQIIDFYKNTSDKSNYTFIAMVLLIIGAFTKSAQFPFHIWLPDAMAAPTPISSYLHSATMVKAGVYLLLRTSIIFSLSYKFSTILIIFGTLTMLIGSINAVFLKDLKAILAYSTISQLGMMTIMIGIGSLGLYNNQNVIYTFAFYAVCFHILNHAVFKACLFMIAGIIDHTVNSRNISLIRGAKTFLPISFIISILAALSMAGVPPFSGFYSKEFFLTVVYQLANISSIYYLVILLIIIASIGTFVYSIILAFKPFLGKFDDAILKDRKLHKPSKGFIISPLILAILTLINNFYKDYLVIPAQQSIVYNKQFISNIKHNNLITTELLTSIVIIILGLLIYFTFANKNKIYSYNPVIVNIQELYNKGGFIIHSVSKILHDNFVTNRLRRNMSYIFLSLSATIIFGYFFLDKPKLIGNFSKIHYMNIIIAIGIIVCCIALSKMTNRIAIIMTSSGVGFMMTALYVTFRAPDLAMTQFVIESISTIIFLIAFILLTKNTKHIEKITFKFTNAFIAIITGISFIIVGLVSYAYKNPSIISPFYSNNVVPSGGGNIVNVIIVDFRGFDTLFEITVMSMVALIIYSMFKIMKKGEFKNEN